VADDKCLGMPQRHDRQCQESNYQRRLNTQLQHTDRYLAANEWRCNQHIDLAEDIERLNRAIAAVDVGTRPMTGLV
jgi:hypothetical protein